MLGGFTWAEVSADNEDVSFFHNYCVGEADALFAQGEKKMADTHGPREWIPVGVGTADSLRCAREAIRAKWPGRFELDIVEPSAAGDAHRLMLRHAQEPDVEQTSATGG